MADDDPSALPRSAVDKFVNELLPDSVRCSAEARGLVYKCAQEFVQMLSSVAAEQAAKTSISQAKAKGPSMVPINAQHIIQSLEELEYPDYVEEVEDMWQHFKEGEKTRKSIQKKVRRKPTDSGMTEEELLAEQKRLYEEATGMQWNPT